MRDNIVDIVKIIIKGKKVQGVGYRLFLLEKALEYSISHFYARNIDNNIVEIFIQNEKSRVDDFYKIIKKKKPEDALIDNISKEPYEGDLSIPSIEKYYQHLTLEQISRGREEIVSMPELISGQVGPIISSLEGIDGKFGEVIKRYGLFGEYVEGMDNKLSSINGKFTGMDEKLLEINLTLNKIATLPEKLDELPDKIAKAINSNREG